MIMLIDLTIAQDYIHLLDDTVLSFFTQCQYFL